MSFNIVGALGGAVAGFFIGAGPWGAAAGFAVGGFSGTILGGLFDLPTTPAGLKQSKQTDPNFRHNQAALGQPMTVGLGRWKSWPNYATYPYSYYVDHKQRFNARLRITVNAARILAVSIGDAAFNSFANASLQIINSGQRLTLFNANVYTHLDVTGLDLDAGAQRSGDYTATYEFAPAGFPKRILLRGSDIIAFSRFTELWRLAVAKSLTGAGLSAIDVGSTITVSGSGSNDGTMTVTAAGVLRDARNQVVASYVDVDTTRTAEVDECAIAYTYTESLDNLEVLKVNPEDEDGSPVTLVFDAALSEIRGPAGEGVLQDLRPGDLIGIDGSDFNDATTFSVIDNTLGDRLTVFPAPAAETKAVTLFLARRWVGPRFACPPGASVDTIEIDIGFDGLGKADDDTDKVFERTVTFMMAYRACDDAGQPLEDWTYESFPLTDKKLEARRFTVPFYLDTPVAHPQVKVARTTPKTNSTRARDTAQWIGLRGYIVALPGDDPALCDGCVDLAITVQSSGQLSQASEQRVNVTSQGIYPVLVDGEWIDTETRNPAWLALYWLTSQSKGLIDYSAFDLPVWAARAEQWAGITFDAEFDEAVSLEEGANSILAVARAKLRKDTLTGLLSLYVDEPTAPTLLLVDGMNTEFQSEQIAVPTRDSLTGVKFKFTDANLWQLRDGPVVGSDVDPQEITLLGCTTWSGTIGSAWEMANYRYLHNKLRVHTLTTGCEMEGLTAYKGQRVLYASRAQGYGQGGIVDGISGLTLQLRAPLVWTDGMQHFVYLQGRDGAPGARIDCTRGDADDVLILAGAVNVTPRADSDTLPMLLGFGHDGDEETPADAPLLMIVETMAAQGLYHATLALRNEDLRVHADPGPAPVDTYALSGEAPTLAIATLDLEADSSDVTATMSAVADGPSVDDSLRYELAWRYFGELDWIVVFRGSGLSATWPVPYSGVVEVRARALSVDVIGPENIGEITVGAVGGALSASLSVSILSQDGPGMNVTTAGSCTVGVFGGTPPYAFDWSVTGGIDAVSDSAQTTKFVGLGMDKGEERSGSASCLVTDSLGATTTASACAVSLYRTGTVPPGGGTIP